MKIVREQKDQIWFGGYGPDPYCYYAQQGPKKFLGATFILEREEDLQRYYNSLP